MDKLKEYISGQYVSLEYDDILDSLLQRVRDEFAAFSVDDIVTDDDGFVQVDNDDDVIWK